MFSIYSTEKALEDICLGVKYPNWNAIAQKQNEIKTNATNDRLLADESPLNIFSQMYGVSIITCDDYLNRIINDPKAVLENPCGAFILDIDKNKANEIQEDYGVICQSANGIEDNKISELLFYTKRISSEVNEIKHSWQKLLNHARTIPSNFLIINDRNLFANDDNINKKGVENMIDIIKSVLPHTLICEYHILIITNKFKNGIGLSQIASWLNDGIQGARAYTIIVELIHIKNNSCPHYDKTHNRRIISNYSVLKADHMYKAFAGNRSLCDQTIDFDTLYSMGIVNDSDCPEKAHRKTISDMTEIANYGKNNHDKGYYAYAINGNANTESMADIKNHLLK